MTKPVFWSEKRLFWTVFFFAVFVRLVFFSFYANSPFCSSHKVPGLDMETLLAFSEWGEGKIFQPLFVVHRLLIFALWKLNGQLHDPFWITGVQSFAGAAGAGLVMSIALMLWGKRVLALACGLLYALYGPMLMYEFTILQESVVCNLILLGSWMALRTKIRHYPAGKSFLSGICWGLASIGRPVAVLLAGGSALAAVFNGIRRRNCKPLLMIAGIAVLLAGASVFNLYFATEISPFFRAMGYTVQFNVQQASSPQGNRAVPAEFENRYIVAAKHIASYLPKRCSQFFLSFEMPENLNYYFIRERLPVLKYLLSPAMVMPFALAGFFLMLFRWKKRESLIVGALILLAVPLAMRDPIGRYRLLLMPGFFLCAAYWFKVLLYGKKKKALFASAALAAALGLNILFSPAGFIRSSDFVAWGCAIEAENGGEISPLSINEFYQACRFSRFNDRSAAVNLITRLLKIGDFSSGAKICTEGIAVSVREKSLFRYYLAMIHISAREFSAAMEQLRLIDISEIPAFRTKYQLMLDICRRENISAGNRQKIEEVEK